MRPGGWATAAVLIGLWPCAAHATGERDATLKLAITGRIAPRCEIALGERRIDAKLSSLPSQTGQERLGFKVRCNQTMAVTMLSKNGGLEHATHAQGKSFPGFLNFLPYQADFEVNAAGARPIAASSEEMRRGAGGSISTIPYDASGSVKIRWAAQQPLVGGVFQDVIEIRVSGAGENEIPR